VRFTVVAAHSAPLIANQRSIAVDEEADILDEAPRTGWADVAREKIERYRNLLLTLAGVLPAGMTVSSFAGLPGSLRR
jgi:hypothetical protein